MKIDKSKPMRYSLASYYQTKYKANYCDLKELAEILTSVNEIPERINLIKATEISLMAQHYLELLKESKRKKK